MAATTDQIEELANREYRYGFVTEIESRPSTIRMSGCQGVSFLRASIPAATERNRVPEDRTRCPMRSTGLEEERDTKCRNQRVP